MGVPTLEVGYTSATARRGDHESSYEHVVALEKKIYYPVEIFGNNNKKIVTKKAE